MPDYLGLVYIVRFEDDNPHVVSPKIFTDPFQENGIGIVVGQGTNNISIDLQLIKLKPQKDRCDQHNRYNEPPEVYDSLNKFFQNK